MKVPRTFYILITLVGLVLYSCTKTSTITQKTIADTDRYYSSLSAEKGRNKAFLAMFDSTGVMLGSHRPPVEGYKAISNLLLSKNDSSYILTWEPTFSKVAKSGELGYSYGLYKLTDKASKKIIGEGTYTTFWQKNAAGEWKALLDTGNEGLK
jgi:ketosteroid isomerase-like protein